MTELDQILTFVWPKVVRWSHRQDNDFVRSFAMSIARHSKRPDWEPSPKQWAIMQNLIHDYRSDHTQPDMDVIERGQA